MVKSEKTNCVAYKMDSKVNISVLKHALLTTTAESVKKVIVTRTTIVKESGKTPTHILLHDIYRKV